MSANRQLQQIAVQEDFEINKASPLTGGDINDVYFIETTSGKKLVAKLNDAEKFPGMFEAEKTGLEHLSSPGVIDVPEVLSLGEVDNSAYLLLVYRETAAKSSKFAQNFGRQLAELHQVSVEKFGFPGNNYIGSLPQYNKEEETASDFYINQRLKPQLKMAKANGYELKADEIFFQNIKDIIPDEPPALIHGDLWGGNYLVNQDGEACLIDPATAYAPREMDLAMMKLFGGFENEVFSSYEAQFPLEPGFKERFPLWQLYYLLVHLNLFGTGYLGSVTSIIKRYR